MRVIGCDCGFEASDYGEGGLVERAQNHARRVHGMELPAELILALARAAPSDHAPRPEQNGQT
jgi:hypothetical protein